jgi:ribosomal protein L14E/L6E/L27E
MAGLRTGRKSIPIHPVRVRHIEPTRTRRPKKEPQGWDDEKIMKALKELKRAAYDQDAPTVARLEAKLDRLLA